MPAPTHPRGGSGRIVRVPTRGQRYTRVVASARLLSSLTAFLTAQQKLNRAWLRSNIEKHPAGVDVLAALDEENRRQAAFAQRSQDRITAGLPAALERAVYTRRDRRLRQQAVQGLLGTEMRYAQLRSREMARRAFAAVNRAKVREASPRGAFWMLGYAKDHTPGCLTMAGRFWPWVVLERVHPPRHPGCTSSLHTLDNAVANGWMAEGDVPSLATAIEAASGVMMEGVADALLAELEVRERLVELGVDAGALEGIPWLGEAFDEVKHPRDWRGRWVNVGARKSFSYDELDRSLGEWLAPAELDAKREVHPRSGFDVKVGLERRLAPPPEGMAEGPAVFNVTDHGQVSDKGLRFPQVIGQEPVRHVYRGVSEAEWEQIQRDGFVQSDKRGVIADWEGTNAADDPRSAVSYLPTGARGRVLKIRVEPADGWFTRREDGYVRTRARVPIDRVEAVSPVIAKDAHTNLSLVPSERLALPSPAQSAADHTSKEVASGSATSV